MSNYSFIKDGAGKLENNKTHLGVHWLPNWDPAQMLDGSVCRYVASFFLFFFNEGLSFSQETTLIIAHQYFSTGYTTQRVHITIEYYRIITINAHQWLIF